MKKYLFQNHIKRCKNEILEFEKNIENNIKDYLRVETKKYLEEANNFFNSIDANTYEDFDKFNKYIKALNDELNIKVKSSSNISPLVYVMKDINESDYYTYKQFISLFYYDEKLFKNAGELELKYLKTLNRMIKKVPEDFEAYKERGDLKIRIGLYTGAIEDYEYALKLNSNYDEAKKSLEDFNKKLESKDFSNKYNNNEEDNEKINIESENKYLKELKNKKFQKYKEKHKNIEVSKKHFNPKTKAALQNLLKNERINLADISTVLVEDMSSLFSNSKRKNFDGIETWDVSNVSNMYGMFWGASSFNQDISSWDVSNVQNMSYMFLGAFSFNQDISSWDVSNVKNMSYMFSRAYSFNQPIGKWGVINVTDMSYMFSGATVFNQDIGNLNVSNVTNMLGMFSGATVFNQNISAWDVGNVINMRDMFKDSGMKELPFWYNE